MRFGKEGDTMPTIVKTLLWDPLPEWTSGLESLSAWLDSDDRWGDIADHYEE